MPDRPTTASPGPEASARSDRPGASAHPPIFDGHNDVLLQLQRAGGVSAVAQFVRGRGGALDLRRARAGGFGGGMFALYVPSPLGHEDFEQRMKSPPYKLPLPAPVPQREALACVMEQATILLGLEEAGAVSVCRNVEEIEAARRGGGIAAVMHMEGAEAIDRDLNALHVLHAAGLRSLGPVWSRPTDWGHGVPFAFPSSPDIGPGLTEDGLRLLDECARLGILFDVSHLNEAGFRDVATRGRAPIVATHSNAHALTPHSRNLTDRQLDAVRDSDGMVGVNFAVAFLREDGRTDPDTPLERVVAHIEHLMERLGESRVGFGSDFDGAELPAAMGDVVGLTRLRDALRSAGHDEAAMERLCWGNWMRVLRLLQSA